MDRVEKRDHYLSNGVAEYWIVDLDARHVERWYADRPTPTLARESLTWRSPVARSELHIDLPRFFTAVSGKLRRR
jgi:Uma2 family endonuclease